MVRIKSTEYSQKKLLWMLLLSQQLWLQGVTTFITSWINAKVGDKVTVELETTAS